MILKATTKQNNQQQQNKVKEQMNKGAEVPNQSNQTNNLNVLNQDLSIISTIQ